MRLTFELGSAPDGSALLHVRFGTATLTDEHSLPYDPHKLGKLSRDIIAVLRRGNRGSADGVVSELRFLGEELHRALVPSALDHELGRGAGPLLLDLDEQLVSIPFELLHDASGFLCRRYALGRSVRSTVPRRGQERRALGMPPRALIVGVDPRGDLVEVRAECDAIVDVLDKERVRARLLGDPERETLRRELKDFDLVHFAGHADFIAGDPTASGWHVADGKLTAADVAELAGGRPMPLVVFSNACESGRSFVDDDTISHESRQAYGLAGAFLYAGVRHYIGTQWEVVDGHSATFATAFYENLATGQAIGAAVRNAREAVIKARGEGALAWASYVLYGDPADRPLRRMDPKQLSLPSARDLAARQSAPWKRPTPQTMKRVGQEIASRRPGRASSGTTRALIAGASVGLLVTAAVAAVLWARRPEPSRLAMLPIAATEKSQSASLGVAACVAGALAMQGAPLIDSAQVHALGTTTSVVADDDSRALSLGAALGARWVLWGVVREAPLRAELRLLEVKSGRVLRSAPLSPDDNAACAAEARALAAALR